MEERLQEIISNFRGKEILVIGDIILDYYKYGRVDRISPEAPVLVHSFEKGEYRLGGAANVAANIASLSGKPTLLGFIGQDFAGQELISLIKEYEIDFLPQYNKKTTLKTRYISRNQQVFRADDEDKTPKQFNADLVDVKARKADLVIVSDYAKGAVTPNLMQVLLQTGKKIIVDPKQNKELYQGVFLITPNEEEARIMSGCLDIREAGVELMHKLSSHVIITRGKQGMMIFNERDIRDIPTSAEEVYDVTGAGDTVIATLGLALASNASLDEAAILANHTAGIVVAKPGTARANLSELETKLFHEIGKIKTLEELQEIVRDYKTKGKQVVWTNGCFDLLHQGHISYLRSARAVGDCLIVGLNSDSSVRKLKGEGRPVQLEPERAEILSALEFVDYVLIFPETSIEKYLSVLKPDIYAKGSDYSLQTMNQTERAALEGYGGKPVFIPLTPGKSTTELINRVKRTQQN